MAARGRLPLADFHDLVLAMFEHGRIPVAGDAARDFWLYAVMPAALARQDVAVAKRILAAAQAHRFFGGENARHLGRYAREIATLEKEG